MSEPGRLLLFADAPRQEQAPRKQPQDQPARDAALDITSSWIVQAPAGAGKTELLTQRYLRLLAEVDQPEEILAITFTRAATAEMRGRIVDALEEAARLNANDPQPAIEVFAAGGGPQTDEAPTLVLARAALRRSAQRGWQLLEQPHRLDVQTIDSLCLRLAHGQPLLSRLGGRLEPTEQAAPLYALAAQRTFAQLGRASSELEAALRHLLLLRDNNVEDCQRLIAEMLEQREQWRHVFVLSDQASIDWEQVRAQLEAPFSAEIRRVLRMLQAALEADPTLITELLELAQYACNNGSPDIRLLHGLQALPDAHPSFLDHWGCLRSFLLTKEGKWRRTATSREGFPRETRGTLRTAQPNYKQRMSALLALLQRDPQGGERLRELLSSVPALPAGKYDETQWQTLLSVFRVLRRAVAELHVVFAERDQVDFAELSIAASTVLDDKENTRGLLASESKRHLLIDEFQDTSRRQHQLIGRLLQEWQPGDGRTCFLVGDPMQSIYIFRQAEVELFGRVQRRGLDCGDRRHACAQLQLSENFRSHAGLVEPLKRYFTAIFAEEPLEEAEESLDNVAGEVPFAPSTSATPAIDRLDAVEVHPSFCVARERESVAASWAEQVSRVVELVAQEQPRILAAQPDEAWVAWARSARAGEAAGEVPPPPPERAGRPRSYTVAVLGRAKNHLAPIAAALRARNIPFRAVELESLGRRQEVIDLQSLLRALLHPMDRIAWLSVLRAPWCGLTLGDLHALTGADQAGFRHLPVTELIAARTQLLSPDGQQRVARVAKVLARATAERTHSLAAWVERAWTSLGAPAYLTPEERENAETFFRLLDRLPPDGIEVLNGSLDTALAGLCAAPDARVSENFGVQLMTIHKAKGLGFDVVIVPALERKPAGDGSPLITMLERMRPRSNDESLSSLHAENRATQEDEVLVAPLGARGEQHRTYKWVQSRRRLREAGERKRLFYVACTRARRQLHLLGTAEITASGQLRPGASDSLLACAWPALEPIFQASQGAVQGPGQHPAAAGQSGPLLVPAETSAKASSPQPGTLEQVAAVGMPPATTEMSTAPAAMAASDAMRLLRVPSGFVPGLALANVTAGSAYPHRGAASAVQEEQLRRPEGSLEGRARGNAVHAMLEMVSERWAQAGRSGEPAEMAQPLERAARTILRRAGLVPARIEALTTALVPILLASIDSPEGRWILSPHPGAQSEWSFSGWTATDQTEARLRTLRVDRTFRAGDSPLSEGTRCLWVIDYKTGAEPGSIALDVYLEEQKDQWRVQLEAYGSALRAFYGEGLLLRYGLYFPELLRLKSWSG